MSKCKRISWQLSICKLTTIKQQRKGHFITQNGGLEWPFLVLKFQTVRFSRRHIHFDTPSSFSDLSHNRTCGSTYGVHNTDAISTPVRVKIRTVRVVLCLQCNTPEWPQACSQRSYILQVLLYLFEYGMETAVLRLFNWRFPSKKMAFLRFLLAKTWL